MKYVFLLWCLSWMYSAAWSQVITIIDDENNQPVELAIVTSEDPRGVVITDPEGEADITSFRGSPRIEIKLLGYQTLQTSYAQLEAMHFMVRMPRDGISLDQIIVSATRWRQGSKEVPAKISSISMREMALLNPQNAADLLGASGEVFIQKSQQGGGSPMIRGFSTNRLLYVIDGVRMNTAIFRSGNLQNVISLDPFATERVEVLFGPGSVIYGSDAIGGVMSFQTLTPELSRTNIPLVKGKAIARYASANREATAHFDIHLGWKKWAMWSSVSSNDFDDLRMGTYGPKEYRRPFFVQRQDSMDVVITNDDPLIQRPSGYSQINFMQKLRFVPDERWDFQYGLHSSTTSGYSRYDRHVGYRNNLPRYGEWEYGPQRWMMNNLSVHYNHKSPFFNQVVLRAAFQKFEESRIDRDYNADERHIRIEQVDAFSLNLDFAYKIRDRDKLFYGFESVWNDVTSTGRDENIKNGTIMDGPARYPQALWSSYAAYINYQWALSEKMVFQAGSRYSRFLQQADFDLRFYAFPFSSLKIHRGALTGSLGLVMSPTEKWTISANLSTGFRAPNVDDSGKVFDPVPGVVTVPNPNLKAEYAYNAEAGIAHVFGKSVKVDVTGYYTLLDQAMVRRGFTFNGQDSLLYNGQLNRVQAIQNAADAHVYGVQAGMEVRMKSGFYGAADFNYQVGEEELDDGTTSPSRHAAPLFGTARIGYNKNHVNLLVYAMYSGGKDFEDLPFEERGKPEIYAIDDQGNSYSPAWATLNFKASYRNEGRWMVSAGLENLTDRRYRPYSSGIVAPGRNFILSFQVFL